MFFSPNMKRVCNIEDARFVSRLGCVYMCGGDTFLPFALSFMQQMMSHII